MLAFNYISHAAIYIYVAFSWENNIVLYVWNDAVKPILISQYAKN